MPKLIENAADLELFCQHLKKQKFITVDLEFLREKTYFAQLCLIQVGCIDDAAVIDPLAPDINLEPFFQILADTGITKVFHSARQDLEILYLLTGFIPEPLFDTQLAAMVCGFGECISYENLVFRICNEGINKSFRFTNWEKRPLDKAQLEYAIGDVTHLVDIYLYLLKELKKNQRLHWIDEEMEVLRNPRTYVVKPQECWQKIKHRSHNPAFLTILRELAAWRENRAIKHNITKQLIIKDDCLLDIAASLPKNVEELKKIRNIRADTASGRLGAEIIEVLENCRNIPKSEYVVPPAEKNIKPLENALLDLLKLLLKIKSQQHGVVARLIASEEDLRRLTVFDDENNPVLKGWRLDIFGHDALALREGRLSIRFNKKAHSIDLQKI